MKVKGSLYILFTMAILVLSSSCFRSKKDPGREYMPDMKHSVSYQANYYDYYWFNRWGGEEEYYQFALPRRPVKGTMPRGYVGIAYAQSIEQRMRIKEAMKGLPMNGHVPFYYVDTNEDRKKAEQEITENPFPITKAGIEKGQKLFDIYCAICHGGSGEGNGYLVRENGGKYPAVPANLVSDEFIDTTVGVFYYTIMYGKNMMGSYADKLSYKERWDVIHYIRSLQAQKRGVEYSASANTLNNEAVPYSKVVDEIKEAKLALKKDGLYGDLSDETSMNPDVTN